MMRMLAKERRTRLREQGRATLGREEAPAVGLLDWITETYPSYRAGWVHRRICDALARFSDAVARGESPRLAIFLPPRHGKSFIVSERFPVWHLGRFPHHHVVVASYGQALSNKFSKRARNLARDDRLMRHFAGFTLDPEKQAVEEWETTADGSYKAVGVGGGLTGSGANVLILDDLVKDEKQADSETYREGTWEWYTHTAYTRLMPGGGVLLIMTRWHEDDIAGRLLKAAQSGGDEWEVLCFPAIAEADEPDRKAGEALHPERFSPARLEKIKGAIGIRAWLALYQQRPTAAEGNILKRDWWRFYKVLPELEYLILSVDAAFKDSDGSDYVVMQVWGRAGARFFLVHQVRDRLGYAATKTAIRNLKRLYPDIGGIFIEDAANGTAVIEELGHEIPGIIPIRPMGGKVARANAAQPFLEAGNCFLPDPDEPGNEWVAEFIEECAAFPRGAHDDQVDAWSQAMAQLGHYEAFEPEGLSY